VRNVGAFIIARAEIIRAGDVVVTLSIDITAAENRPKITRVCRHITRFIGAWIAIITVVDSSGPGFRITPGWIRDMYALIVFAGNLRRWVIVISTIALTLRTKVWPRIRLTAIGI
jgi:hypothetical protein